jgi:hypothetical protein
MPPSGIKPYKVKNSFAFLKARNWQPLLRIDSKHSQKGICDRQAESSF